MTTAAEPDTTGDELARAKPPFLKRVRIRNYKSIEFCDVALEPLTLFVGRNASGKSNFLDALGFLSDLMDVSASEAVERRNGWNCVHFRGDTTGEIEFQIEGVLNEANWREFCYTCTLRERIGTQEIDIVHERFQLTPPTRDDEFGYRITGDELDWLGMRNRWSGAPLGNRLLLGHFGMLESNELAKSLRTSRVFNFSPGAMRALIPAAGRAALSSNGENLARTIRTLQSSAPRRLERVVRYLSVIVPEIKDVSSIQLGSHYLTVGAAFQTGVDRTELFEAASLSDGTLRALAALVGVNQLLSYGASKDAVFAIEEPETALHPAAMRALVDALDEATLHTQVLLTTHSADMLDNPTIGPENVRVVQMIDGRTVVAPVDEASVEIVQRDLDTLGGLERQNQLEPNIDDVERQLRLSKNGQEPKS